jgi:ABC-type lipopolysaccharide export system ATPase subunit
MGIFPDYQYGNRINTFRNMTGLHVDSVIKTFGTIQVLTDIFISCKQGEIIGLLGRNGSGKTTLLKIIFGSLSADTKFVKVGSKIINSLFDSRKLISYLPQDSFMPNHIKIKTIISLLCNDTNLANIANNAHIRPLLNKKSKELSGGEKRLVEIYLIAYSNAKFILLDEPFNGISPLVKEDIKNLIREQSKYKGFIITDHDYRNILDVSTRTILMHDGGAKEIKHKDELIRWEYIPKII